MLKSQDLSVGDILCHRGPAQWLVNHLGEEIHFPPSVNTFPLALDGDVMIVLAISHLKNSAYVLLFCAAKNYGGEVRSEKNCYGWIHASGNPRL